MSVFKAQWQSLASDQPEAKKQISVFWWGILIIFIWQFLPAYIFPMTSSLALLCWFSKHPTAQFLGSGLGGVGFLNITLDWSNIESKFIYYPYWTSMNIFLSYIIAAWILIPIAFFGKHWQTDQYPIQSQSLRLRDGSNYATTALMNADYSLNETLFAEYGPPMMSVQLRWMYFFSYVAWIGAFVTCALFKGAEIRNTFISTIRTGGRYNDKLTQMIRKYPTVPLWCNVVLFLVPFVLLVIFTAKGFLYMPIYMLFIGLAIGAAIVVPMSYVYAVSGYQMQVGYFNELFYGYAINLGGSRHPIGSLSYRLISGQCWYEAQAMLADMKLGHYFHIPPRVTMRSQLWGLLVGVPVNYATILWVCKTKRDVMRGLSMDPNHQWTVDPLIHLFSLVNAFPLTCMLHHRTDSQIRRRPGDF